MYINREISWLSFNARVLQEAEDRSVPLFERLRFIGIFSNNLDEFFRVRVASVRRMLDLENDEEILGDYTAVSLYNKIQETVNVQQQRLQEIYREILQEMEAENIFIVNEKQLSREQGIVIRQYFQKKVLPNLVPIMVSKDNKFPYLRDRSVYLAVKMSNSEKSEKQPAYALVRIPARSVPRYFVLPEKNRKKYVIFLDDIIRYCMDDIFPLFNFDCYHAYTIKITRDAELDFDDDISKSFVEKMELSLKQRKKGTPVRLIYDSEIPDDLLNLIVKKMKLKEENIVSGGRYHNKKDLMTFPEIGAAHHYYRQLPPVRHCDLNQHESILRRLRSKDIMLHYPYQTFTHVIDLLREAAIDPKVVEIGITIYRVANNSRVMNALLNAVRNGKRVTVVVELQARFDEETNIYWSSKLQEEGAHVINGVQGVKVHAKVIWIKRKEKEEYRDYAYIGTGNFNESTAQIYADNGLLTADPQIAREAGKLFEFFKHNYLNQTYNHLVVSPFDMRQFFCRQIDKEIELAKSGHNGYMILKLNSLIDTGMMDKLYEAARYGVKIQLIVRGIFGLRPTEEGHQNIEAISIVDKYLEHSRILLFGNGGDEKIFISSADWMSRNLNRRIEVACPIYNKEIKEELKEMLRAQFRDNTKARILDEQLLNTYNKPQVEGWFRAQEDYYQYIKAKHRIVMKIYHNPKCSKSREALRLLEESGFEVEIKNYIKDGLSEEEVCSLINMTGLPAFELVRTQEELYIKNYKDKEISDEQWVKIISEAPRLLKRPVVVNKGKAVVAIPANYINKLL